MDAGTYERFSRIASRAALRSFAGAVLQMAAGAAVIGSLMAAAWGLHEAKSSAVASLGLLLAIASTWAWWWIDRFGTARVLAELRTAVALAWGEDQPLARALAARRGDSRRERARVPVCAALIAAMVALPSDLQPSMAFLPMVVGLPLWDRSSGRGAATAIGWDLVHAAERGRQIQDIAAALQHGGDVEAALLAQLATPEVRAWLLAGAATRSAAVEVEVEQLP